MKRNLSLESNIIEHSEKYIKCITCIKFAPYTNDLFNDVVSKSRPTLVYHV